MRDLREEMAACPIITDKVLDDDYAKKLYASMCNMRWHAEGDPEPWSCTWRASGRIVSELRGASPPRYMDWYLSSREGIVDPEIEEDLEALGWRKCPWPIDGENRYSLDYGRKRRERDEKNRSVSNTGE